MHRSLTNHGTACSLHCQQHGVRRRQSTAVPRTAIRVARLAGARRQKARCGGSSLSLRSSRNLHSPPWQRPLRPYHRNERSATTPRAGQLVPTRRKHMIPRNILQVDPWDGPASGGRLLPLSRSWHFGPFHRLLPTATTSPGGNMNISAALWERPPLSPRPSDIPDPRNARGASSSQPGRA